MKPGIMRSSPPENWSSTQSKSKMGVFGTKKHLLLTDWNGNSLERGKLLEWTFPSIVFNCHVLFQGLGSFLVPAFMAGGCYDTMESIKETHLGQTHVALS